MNDKDWRSRLSEAVDKSGRSMRDISLAAGLSSAYLFTLLGQGKDPSVDRLVKIADALGISPSWLLFGTEMTGDTEQIIRIYAALSPKRRERALRDMKEALADEQEVPPPEPS